MWSSLLSSISNNQPVGAELHRIQSSEGWLGLVNFLVLTDTDITGLKSKQNIIHSMSVVGHAEGLTTALDILESSYECIKITDPESMPLPQLDDTEILTAETDLDKSYAFIKWLSSSNHESSLRDEILMNLMRVMSDSSQITKLIIKSIFSFADAKGRTPLHLSSWNGQLASSKLLISVSSNLDAEESTGHTSLYFACYKNRNQIVRSLVSAGVRLTSSKARPLNHVCSLDSSEHNCDDSFHCYASHDVLKITKILVGADPTCIPPNITEFTNEETEIIINWMRDQKGCPTCSQFDTISQQCRQHLSQCHYPTSDGESAILPRRIIRLISSKYGINTRDSFGHTPLMAAICNKRRCCMRLLVALGANGNIRNLREDTIVHMVINGGLKDYVCDILKMNKPLELGDRKWESPEDVTHSDIKISITKEGEGGLRPAECAQQSQQDDIVTLLTVEHPDLVSPLAEAPDCYRCTLCTEMLVLPCQLQCGHRFCLPCISKAFAHETRHSNTTTQTCPYRCLQRSLTNPVLDEKFENRMMNEVGKDYKVRLQSFYRSRACDIIHEIRKTYPVIDDQLVYASCQFSVGNETFTIAPASNRELLRISCPLLPLTLLEKLSETKKQSVLSYVLESNLLGAKVCGGTVELGYGHILFVCYVSLQLSKNSAATDMIMAMNRCLENYKSNLKKIISSNDETSITGHQGEIPPPNKISEIRGNLQRAELMVDTLQLHLQKKGIIDGSIYYDRRSNWHIKVATTVISITYERSYDILYVYMPIVSIIPTCPTHRNRVFEILLSPQPAAAGIPIGIGYDRNENFILYHMALRVGCVPHTAIKEIFLNFVEAAFNKVGQVQKYCESPHTVLDPCNMEICGYVASKILRKSMSSAGSADEEITNFLSSGHSRVIVIFDSEDYESVQGAHTITIRENPSSVFVALHAIALRGGFSSLYLRLPTSRSAVLVNGVASPSILFDDDTRLLLSDIKSFLESLSAANVRAVLIDG